MNNNKFPFHVLDDLLSGFTHDDLVTAILSNESVITEQAIKKVFNEMLQQQINDAKATLKANMQEVLKICIDNKEV